MDFQNSCTPVVPTPLLRVPIQERPSQVSSYLEPHGWLAQVGSVAWFLSCGPMQVELSHPRWRLGSWGAVLDIWLDICTEASAPPGASERLWAPGQPGAWLTVLAAGWLRAGLPGQGWVLGTTGQAAGQDTPPPQSDSFILVLLIGLGEGWEVRWMDAGSLFSQAPTHWGAFGACPCGALRRSPV